MNDATVHDFEESLSESFIVSQLPFWEPLYRDYWKHRFHSMQSHFQNGPHQKNGVDRTVVLKGGELVKIDEKYRKPNPKTGEVYTDILLEREHRYDDGTVKPGWITKELTCDYIAYAILGLGYCYLFHRFELQQAWKTHEKEWIAQYGSLPSFNRGYKSINTPVPPKVIFEAFIKHATLKFDPVNLES